MKRLKQYGLVYVATPYTKYPLGLYAAFRDACAVAARLIEAGVRAYSPIAASHSIAVHGGLSLTDHSLWLPYNEGFMQRCDALVIALMEGWDQSYGITHEILWFRSHRKSVFSIDPKTYEVVERQKDVA